MEIGIKNYARTGLVDTKGNLAKRLSKSSLKECLIPSCTVDLPGRSDWNVVFEEGPFALSYDENKKTVYYQNEVEKGLEWDVLYLVRQTLDRQLNEKGYITLHASALKNRDSSILVFGCAGSGKTSIVLEGANRGYAFIGNEFIVISPDLKAVAGTKIINYREEMAQRFFPELQGRGFSPARGVRVLKLEELYGTRVETGPSGIALLINPKISSEFVCYPLNKNTTKNELFGESSVYVSGFFPLDEMGKPCTINLDNSHCRKQRYDLVGKMVDTIPGYRIEGKAGEILSKIEEMR